jgi:hypothetical protein
VHATGKVFKLLVLVKICKNLAVVPGSRKEFCNKSYGVGVTTGVKFHFETHIALFSGNYRLILNMELFIANLLENTRFGCQKTWLKLNASLKI